MIGILAALAREDGRTSNPPTARLVFEGTVLALLFEVEARAWGAEHGVEIVGHGAGARPLLPQ